MKAIVPDEYGSPDDVLALRDIEKPVANDDEVFDLAGHAESVGVNVKHLQPDDLGLARSISLSSPRLAPWPGRILQPSSRSFLV